MLKFNNKRDVDRHVSQMTKNLNENERSTRGYAISKSYVKVSEYEMARDWLQRYLDVKTEDAVAHKFMGEIYEHLKKPEQAITSYQRAFNLNPKQNDLIKNICRLFLVNDGWTSSPGKAKYWCELADTENVRDDNVLSLRLKMLNKDKKSGGKPVEEMILKEIAGRPHDVGLRIRLVKFLLDEKRVSEAFKYCFDLEMKFMEIFLLSIDWYTTVSSVLTQNLSTDNWNYWCLLLISIDKKIYLNLKKDLSLQAIKQTNIKEVTNLIFEFDQVLKKAADSLLILAPVKELAEEFVNHFRGQLALHIASLLFQKQKVASNDQWRETSKKCLPFLLFAFQCSTVNTDAFWLKNTNDTIRNLFAQLKKEGAFRCAQAGRTILACKSSGSEEIANNIRNYKSWASIEDIFNQVRETCVDLNWRKNVYRLLFANADQQTKVSTSYLVQNSYFQEPKYEIISFNDLEMHEVVAQYLYPSSLEHHVYLGLGRKDLHSYRSYTFNGLNLSASNLINCNPETINRIDIDSFLYCAIIQAKRRLEAGKDCYESFSSKPNEKPLMLPAANMVDGLCTEEQNDWWLSAFKIYKNISGENLAQLKATLQFGIEAVRGIDSPKVDVIILLKLGDVLLARSGSGDKQDERRHLELRVEYVYKIAMRMLKSRDSDNMRRIFKFATTNFDIDREVDVLAGTAIGHLSGIYFKQEEYKEFIEDFGGLQNPWAHYFRAEAYKKLDEWSKTPKKNKKLYAEKARENLVETLALLDSNENIEKNNPLRMRVEKELKKMQYNLSSSYNEEFQNTSVNGHTDEEELVFHNASATSFRGRRDVSASVNYSEKFQEVDSLIKKLTDLVVTVKDDVLCVRNDISDLKDELLNIRGDIADVNINRDSSSNKALTDVFKIMEDLAWNVSYIMNVMSNPAGPQMTPGHAARFQPNPLQAQLNQMYNTAYPMFPMQPQYQASMMQRPPQPGMPGQMPTAQLPFDAMGQNLMMNPQSLDLQGGTPKSSLMEALNTPSLLNTWNNTYNQQPPMNIPSQIAQPPPNITTPVIPAQTHAPIQNKPVEKAPPVNVVITSSDPLPAQNSFVSQPTLSVTIPPQHIKHAPQPVFQTQPVISSTVSKPIYENISPTKLDTSGYLEEPADYDPRPDFQPIIPLPDEIEVKTGEENEDIAFSERCKLFRLVEGEWKERGIGNIKILKNRETGKYRILMRREQIHKLCANHAITPELELKATPKDNQWIWAANDFSDEQMHLEKFLVRFKSSDQAKRFKESFNEAKKLTPKKPAQEKVKEVLKPKDNNAKVKPVASPAVPAPTAFNGSSTPKTAFSFGGLTGSLTPSTGLFSPTVEKTKGKESEKNKVADKPSPFANFSFGQGATNKSFSELFGNISANKESPTASTQVQSSAVDLSLNSSKTNEEDVDHYEPTAQFEPVIPLPDLVEAKTGEEDENVMFAHRAKLLRFDPVTKEWKERGIGEMKVLVHKNDPNKARLLMRREQIFKLCCNMVIVKDLKFNKLNATTYSFGGQDFSENEMRTEALAIKFKTSDLIEEFLEAVRTVQKNMGAVTATPADKEQKTEISRGFGDKFKPKVGSWDCKACYISNKAETLYCCACETPKDDTVPKKEAKSLLQPSADAPKFSFGIPAATPAPTVTQSSDVKGFGDQFKPKVGSWDCKACYISNKADALYCCACESPKDDTVPKKEAKSLLQPAADAPKFSFGMPAAPVAVKSDAAKGFGDQFKPKAGSWDCTACYISNKTDALYCCACESPKDDTVPKKEAKSLLQSAGDVPKFSFGMNSGPGFSFGMPAAAPALETKTNTTIGSTVASPMPTSSFSFGSLTVTPTTAADSTTTNGFGFGSQKSFGFGFGNAKPAEALPVPAVEETPGSEAPGFNFVFKKKSPSKVKSPGKTRNDSVNSEGAAEEDEDEYQEEENQTYFTPVIALPDKIEVKTGEENEEVLYSHRAKLFRFIDKEWKERGLGDIKILKHRETGKLRVVMRREQIFKICLNFQLTNEVEFKPKDDNSWTFAALDFSEGEVEPTQFAIRLKNKEIAEEFKRAIDDALAGESTTSVEDENAKLEKRLMLPSGFFDYLSAPDCSGCVGCDPEKYVFNVNKKSELSDDVKPISQEPPTLKAKPKARRQSVDKRVSFKLAEEKDESENEKLKQLLGTGNVTDKMNVFGGGIKKSEATSNIFAAFNAENPPTTPIFGPASTTNIFGAKQDSTTANGNSIFSSSLNTTPSAKATEDSSPFGVKPSEPFSGGLFGNKSSFSFASGDNIFSAQKENGDATTKSTFGAFSATPTFGSNVFGNSLNKPDSTTGTPSANIFGASLNLATPDSTTTTPASTNIFGSSLTSTFSFAEAARNLDANKPPVVPEFLKVTNDSGGFAALAATGTTPEKTWTANAAAPPGGFFGLTVKDDFFSKNVIKQTNPDAADSSQNESTTDENYDPHYDPIIALPDEINVSTGEEEEEKLFGERAKLFRYDTKTKEWKERGVGEIKILHHAGNGTYRLLLRREQIFKLVLNQLISTDFNMAPMNNSPKAFCWAGMNYAEGAGEAEQLAIRFKNEDLASSFKKKMDECVAKIESRGNLNPEND